MRIYKINADFKNYDSCGLDLEICRQTCPFEGVSDLGLFINFEGLPQSMSWWPRKVVRSNNHPLGDYISNLNGSAIIMEKKSIDKLKPLMGDVEILPLDCDFGDYWAINILSILNCIDYEKSDFKAFPGKYEGDRPRIMYFKKYEFLREEIGIHNVFKIIDTPKSAIFVNQTFVDAVNEYAVTGFKFDLVWQDEEENASPEEYPKAGDRKQEEPPMKKGNREMAAAPLAAELVQELAQMKQEAYGLIGADENSTPAETVDLIYQYVERYLKASNHVSDDEIENMTGIFAAAWGAAVCEEYGWEWKYLQTAGEDDGSYYLVSPDHWYCCPPFYFFSNILNGTNIGANGENDNTVLLLFNMIKTLKKTDKKYTVIS